MIQRVSTAYYDSSGERIGGEEETRVVTGFDMPVLFNKELKPGEKVAIRVTFESPLPETPGSKLFDALNQEGNEDYVRIMGDWRRMSDKGRAIFEKIAMRLIGPFEGESRRM